MFLRKEMTCAAIAMNISAGVGKVFRDCFGDCKNFVCTTNPQIIEELIGY